MCGQEIIQVDIEGLNENVRRFSFELGDTFFTAMAGEGGYPDFQGKMMATIEGTKGAGCYDFTVHVEGTVTVPCDRCLDDMVMPISADSHLVVKKGEAGDDADEVMTIADNEHVVDLSWFVYETIELAIPIQHVHPEGECNGEMIDVLANHADREKDGDVDPRWKELEKLRTTIND